MSTRLEKLIDEVKDLSAEERLRLRQALDAAPVDQPPRSKGDELAELLFRQGLIGHIPSSSERAAARADDRLVPVQGKPVSETIIEERR